MDRLHADSRIARRRGAGPGNRALKSGGPGTPGASASPEISAVSWVQKPIVPRERCLHELPKRWHLVQLHEPAHSSALSGSEGRVECTDGRGHCRIPAYGDAAAVRGT